MALGDTVKKVFILKIFPKLYKTFCLYSYHTYLILLLKSEKRVAERKDWAFKAIINSLTEETSSWFLLIGSLKMTYARSYARGSWIFFERREGLNRFLWHVLPKVSKITVTCPKVSKRDLIGSILTSPKLAKYINFKLLKVCKMTSLKTYISPVTEKLETPNLGTR